MTDPIFRCVFQEFVYAAVWCFFFFAASTACVVHGSSFLYQQALIAAGVRGWRRERGGTEREFIWSSPEAGGTCGEGRGGSSAGPEAGGASGQGRGGSSVGPEAGGASGEGRRGSSAGTDCPYHCPRCDVFYLLVYYLTIRTHLLRSLV